MHNSFEGLPPGNACIELTVRFCPFLSPSSRKDNQHCAGGGSRCNPSQGPGRRIQRCISNGSERQAGKRQPDRAAVIGRLPSNTARRQSARREGVSQHTPTIRRFPSLICQPCRDRQSQSQPLSVMRSCDESNASPTPLQPRCPHHLPQAI